MSSKRRDALRKNAERYASRRVNDDAHVGDRGPLEDGYTAGYKAAYAKARRAFAALATIAHFTREGELHANADLNDIAKEAIT